jgi:hypothetical protein
VGDMNCGWSGAPRHVVAGRYSSQITHSLSVVEIVRGPVTGMGAAKIPALLNSSTSGPSKTPRTCRLPGILHTLSPISLDGLLAALGLLERRVLVPDRTVHLTPASSATSFCRGHADLGRLGRIDDQASVEPFVVTPCQRHVERSKCPRTADHVRGCVGSARCRADWTGASVSISAHGLRNETQGGRRRRRGRSTAGPRSFSGAADTRLSSQWR